MRTRPGHRDVAAITDLDQLRDALQTAIELEHSTIPPYLCALYSIPREQHRGRRADRERRDGGDAAPRPGGQRAQRHRRRAAIESPDFVPRYPATLPHSDGRIIVGLRPCRRRRWRRSGASSARAAAARGRESRATTRSASSTQASSSACSTSPPSETSSPATARQIAGNEHVYGMAGAPFAVHDLDSALGALADHRRPRRGHRPHDPRRRHALGEGSLLAHYYRFDEIAKGRRYLPSDTPRTGPTGPPLPVDYDAVWPMRANPRVEDLPPAAKCGRSPTRPTAIYTDLLRCLHRGLNGEPSELTGRSA